MHRFAPTQPDLFAPSEPPPTAAPASDPVAELTTLLDMLRSAERLPWPDAAATMAEEHRALGLARIAGPAGAPLVAALLEQTERLLALTD
jgi:hypothetical protein